MIGTVGVVRVRSSQEVGKHSPIQAHATFIPKASCSPCCRSDFFACSFATRLERQIPKVEASWIDVWNMAPATDCSSLREVRCDIGGYDIGEERTL